VTTTHVSNQCNTFTTYYPAKGMSVIGIRNVETPVARRGMVELESTYNGCKYTLQLHNVLHIPSNQNNLISWGNGMKWVAVMQAKGHAALVYL
jgi:hypothetical protein